MKVTKSWIANFVYNSNGIEGYLTPAKHVEETLSGKSQSKSPLILNQIAAIEYVKKHHKERPTLNTISELHSILLKDVDSWAGIYRRCPVWIGGQEAPDHKKVLYLIKNWIALWDKKPRKTWTNKKAAMYRHYEYECIHPFTDGNGRSGRLLLLWDCLHHRTSVDFPECANTLRAKYYASIQRYRTKERDEYMGEWV